MATTLKGAGGRITAGGTAGYVLRVFWLDTGRRTAGVMWERVDAGEVTRWCEEVDPETLTCHYPDGRTEPVLEALARRADVLLS